MPVGQISNNSTAHTPKLTPHSKDKLSTQKEKAIAEIIRLESYGDIEEALIKHADLLFTNQSLFSNITRNIPDGAQIALLVLVKYDTKINYDEIKKDPDKLEKTLREKTIQLSDSFALGLKKQLEEILNEEKSPSSTYKRFDVAIKSARADKFTNSWFTNYQQFNLSCLPTEKKPLANSNNFNKEIPNHDQPVNYCQPIQAGIRKEPEDTELKFKFPLRFKQGATGDCYLLSTLYTISRYSWGQKKLDGMFSKTITGAIKCKLQLNHNTELYDELKKNYNTNKNTITKSGYSYSFNDSTKTVTVELTPEKAKKIRNNRELSETTDFNIKYLEVIVAKLMQTKQNKVAVDKTIAFHDLPGREEEKIFSLLGIQCFEVFGDDNVQAMGNVIRSLNSLKGEELEYPVVYLSLDVPKSRCRHAYVLIGIYGDKYRLVDPHDTEASIEMIDSKVLDLKPKYRLFLPYQESEIQGRLHLANLLAQISER